MDQRMWMWRSVLCMSLVYGLALDSNTIRASKEAAPQDRSHGDQVERAARRQTETNSNSNQRAAAPCSTAECNIPVRGGCSNRAQRRPSSQDRQVDGQGDRQVDGQGDRQVDTDSFNRTKAPEMASCVRSGDCGAGLCCVRYLTGKRCQKIPREGEACLLLRGSTKLRRNLGRCHCHTGLSCTAIDRAESGKNKGQGVCLPRPQQGQRKTRHSGEKRRTLETSC
ncbi:dickkopf-related protein 4 [Paralichthys olivaceus]|uniref:dickkopf-related protein 4 n=1 Tax=Paralichthys olivaceus TaxID=8255 RepID=UPI003751C4AC